MSIRRRIIRALPPKTSHSINKKTKNLSIVLSRRWTWTNRQSKAHTIPYFVQRSLSLTPEKESTQPWTLNKMPRICPSRRRSRRIQRSMIQIRFMSFRITTTTTTPRSRAIGKTIRKFSRKSTFWQGPTIRGWIVRIYNLSICQDLIHRRPRRNSQEWK